jgi:hypothetical protein
LIFGALIELLQNGFHRTPNIGDIFRNLIGAMACIVFLSPSRKSISKHLLLILQLNTVILICLQIYPVIIAFADEYISRRQFPELSGFETPFEIQRWSGGADFLVDKRIKQTGKASMKVIFSTNRYSGVGLKYFPRNWESFSYFQFSIFNPSTEEILITCRIHDNKLAKQGQKYEDKFHQSFSMPKGWQTITISLEDIKHGPKNRKMNLHKILNAHFFVENLPYQRTIYIDDVKLLL